MKKVLISFALSVSTVIFAGGFRVSLQGVRQLAMAHTSAHAEDASVAFFNPAGIFFIPSKISVVAGGFAVMSKVTYQSPSALGSYETNDPVGTPFYFAVAGKLSDKVSLGLSVTTPFGSTIEWPSDWAGKEIVQKLALKAFYFEPMVSVKLTPWASFGASYIYAKGSVDWTKAVTSLNGTINLDDNKASGSGFGLGLYLRPDSKWDVSIAYRSPVDMKAKNGKATMSLPNAPASSQVLYAGLGLNPSGQDSFMATLPLVSEFTIGATYKITPKWLISGDFNYHGWKRYSNLTIDFANASLGNQPSDATLLVSEKDWHNTKTFRLGTQYMVNEWIAARLGWYYDESPYDDTRFVAETPSFNSNVFTGGLGFKFNKFGLDVAASQAFPKSRQFNNQIVGFSGQAKATSTYLGLGVSYNGF